MEDTPAPPKFLPDDVLLELLARVAVTDVAALFRCASACKRWCYLITDPSFLCLCWPKGASQSHPSVLVGFFTQQRWKAGDQDDDPCAPPVFVPTARFAFGSGRRSLTSFVRGVLPPLENRSALIRYGYAILTSEDHSTRFFKVLAMGLADNVNDREKLQCDLHTLTSDEPSWTTHTEYFTGAIDLGWQHWKHAVVCDGVVSWLYASLSYNDDIVFYQFSTIDVSAENGHLTLTKLSFPPLTIQLVSTSSCYRLAAVDGTVSLLCLYKKPGKKGLCREIWKQGDDIGGDWPCSRAMKLTGPGDEAAGPLSRMAMDDVPMEIDWPEVIVSRLARYT